MTTIKQLTTGLLLSGLVVFSSCKKDDAPDIDPRDVFVGEYKAEDCVGFGEDLEIEKDSKNAKYIIIHSQNLEDFYNATEVEAEVSGNEFTFEQAYTWENASNGEMIEGVVKGKGKLNGKKLTINVKFSEDGTSDECDIEGDKK